MIFYTNEALEGIDRSGKLVDAYLLYRRDIGDAYRFEDIMEGHGLMYQLKAWEEAGLITHGTLTPTGERLLWSLVVLQKRGVFLLYLEQEEGPEKDLLGVFTSESALQEALETVTEWRERVTFRMSPFNQIDLETLDMVG